jgi:hypothetical protein
MVGLGGLGGGGNGGNASGNHGGTIDPENGSPHMGGGGGGGGLDPGVLAQMGGDGGSGIVLIKFTPTLSSSRDTLDSFLNGTTAYVVKWYDQSPSKNHAVLRPGANTVDAPVYQNGFIDFAEREAFYMHPNNTDTLTSRVSDAVSCYSIVRHADGQGGGVFGGGDRFHFELRGGDYQWRARISDIFLTEVGMEIPADQFYSISCRKTLATTINNHEIVLNGQVVATSNDSMNHWDA